MEWRISEAKLRLTRYAISFVLFPQFRVHIVERFDENVLMKGGETELWNFSETYHSNNIFFAWGRDNSGMKN